MTKRIFRSMFFIALTAVVLVSAFVVLTFFSAAENRAEEDLKTEAGHILNTLSQENNRAEHLFGVFSNNRITYIDANGTVLYDNTTNAEEMGNHSDRPEVISAIENGAGESRRYSETLSERNIYYAVRTDNGNILRLSKTQSSAFGILWEMMPTIILIIAGVAMLSLITARYMAKKIIIPINTLDLDKPLENDTYDELSPLMLRIQRQHEEIRRKIRETTEKQREFVAVTDNMYEGLVLLSTKGTILSINKSALKIFHTSDDNYAGKHILSLNRSTELQSVIEGAVNGEKAESQLRIENRYYQLIGNPVESAEGTLGAVILILDMTDKQNAERSRREFTANVSHELKTPLTSISGFAEIMKNGTAKPEDMKDFAGRIFGESNRMIALIEDILRLSQLDEKTQMPDKENVDLFVLADNVCHLLQPLADKKDISLSVKGEHTHIYGYKNILNEMLYNLCDNAIKYNVHNGTVVVDVSHDENHTAVTVVDTGIGIPIEHQPHVFERFYRVDKSRSKDTGGTGLGLSIVKHGALLHDAQIELKSKENQGTTVVLTFPMCGV